MTNITRRDYLMGTAAISATALTSNLCARPKNRVLPGNNIQYGLVTYMWGAKWDLETLITNCEQARCYGVELRTTHSHGVEPSLNDEQRRDVVKRFADSPVTMVGIGSNERYDNPDPAVVKQAIEKTKDFIRLSHDVGGTGVKVKPDRFYDVVPREKTIEQIGMALNELGEYAAGWGQQIRLEVHGQCAELPTIKAIMDVATNQNVAICWNCNQQDLQGEGLEHNFNLVKDRFGATAHVRPFYVEDYPTVDYLRMLIEMDYAGWFMLEQGALPKGDLVAALLEETTQFAEIKGGLQQEVYKAQRRKKP